MNAQTLTWRETLRGASHLSREYLLAIVLSSSVATFGLLSNSPAVVIGAMLIAPLMTPLLSAALGITSGSAWSAWRAVWTVLIGALVGLGISWLWATGAKAVTPTIYASLTSEVIARGAPNWRDVLIALVGGAAAAYATPHPRLSAVITGAAIATALMPPLSAAAISLVAAQFDLAYGALTLFALNACAIILASSVVFALRKS